MSYSEEYKERIEYMFAAFVKSFSAMRHLPHIGILDGSRNVKYRLTI